MDTVTELKRWMTEVMGQAGICSAADLDVICSGPMAEVWRWVTIHVNTREEVRKMRGNLALSSAVASSDRSCTSSTMFDTERKMMLGDRSRLMGELHAVLMKIQRLRRKMDHAKQEQVKADNKKSGMTRDIELRRQRIALLGLYSRQAQNLLANLGSIADKINEAVKNKSFNTAPKIIISGSVGVVSEENVKIEEVIVNCAGYFQGVLLGNLGPGRSSFKEDVYQSLGKMSGESIKAGLIHHTKLLAQEVAAKADKGFKPAVVIENEEVFFETVGGELLNFCRRHITSNRETVKLEKSCNILEEKLGKYQEQISEDPSSRVAAEIENLQKSLTQLDHQLSNNKFYHSSAIIEAQQEEIDGLCQIISSMILKSSSQSLKPHQLKVLEMLTSAIPYLSHDVSSLAPPLKDLPSSHLKTLNSSPTWKLSSTMVSGDGFMNMTPTCHLSILRNSSKMPQVPSSLESRRLKLVNDLTGLLQEIEDLEKITSKGSEENECSNTVKNLNNLEALLSRNYREQSRNLEPVIEECKIGQEKLSKLLTTFRKVQQDWKREPASDIALAFSNLWGEVEGRTLQQTVDLAKHYINQISK